jgi:hypothetical protein
VVIAATGVSIVSRYQARRRRSDRATVRLFYDSLLAVNVVMPVLRVFCGIRSTVYGCASHRSSQPRELRLTF